MTPAEINETFRNHFSNLAEPKQNIKFKEEHDRQVKIDAELIVNICENSSVTIQPVTPTEISKLVDCSASNLIDSQYRKDVDTICRDMIYALQVKRAELLLE
jgi:low affinity Fe/Cu permease